MHKEHIIKMANQIGDFFKSYPKQDYAEEQIANHLKKFWSPEMRKFLKNEVDSRSAMVLRRLSRQLLKNTFSFFPEVQSSFYL